jgi:8-amino-7-oxononanoate synthase
MLEKTLITKLKKHKNKHLYRTRYVSQDAAQVYIIINGKKYLSFSTNNYLGLANHPEVIKAFKNAVNIYGVGSGAAFLLGGYTEEHRCLEEELAEFLGYPRVLLFSTGYMANLGVVNTCVSKHDYVFADKLSHASLIDACKTSQANFRRYAHKNTQNLRYFLTKSHVAKNKLICSDGVFSMDGDLVSLPELISIAKQYNCSLLIDDAHGIGTLGNSGKGVLEYYNLQAHDVAILVGTFGKAFGTCGAFVAGSDVLIKSLVQFSRTYIYTTAMLPAIAAASRVSLKLLQQEARREKLCTLIKYFKENAQTLNLPLLFSNTPIQILFLGDTLRAVKIANALKIRGIIVGLIRPPTVPANSARLRISLTANHTTEQIDALLSALVEILSNDSQ